MPITQEELWADDDAPIDPTNPTDPVDPIDPVDPKEPVEPTDPVDPGHPRTQTQDPVDPVDPIDPVDPVDPLVDPNDPPVEVSGIEQYLTEHDIIGGLITIEDAEGKEVEKHFDDLSDDEQFNVLKSLAEKSSKQKNGLSEDEVGLVNWVRGQDGTIEEAIESLAQSRLAELSAINEATGVNYTDMSSDALYTKWIQEANPEATEEDIASDLTSAKDSKLYESKVERIRESFLSRQKDEVSRLEAKEAAAERQELEEDRATIVQSVSDVDNILGFPVDDNVKNEVLEKLLEVGESGDSLFMEEIFADPAILFKAAVMHYKGEEYVNSLETYYKKEMTKAHNKGKASVTDGMPSQLVSGRKPKAPVDKPEPTPRGANRISQDELWTD